MKTVKALTRNTQLTHDFDVSFHGPDATLSCESGGFEDNTSLVLFLFLLLRDHLPSGVVEELVRESSVAPEAGVRYSNAYLAQYATNLALRLLCIDVPEVTPIFDGVKITEWLNQNQISIINRFHRHQPKGLELCPKAVDGSGWALVTFSSAHLSFPFPCVLVGRNYILVPSGTTNLRIEWDSASSLWTLWNPTTEDTHVQEKHKINYVLKPNNTQDECRQLSNLLGVAVDRLSSMRILDARGCSIPRVIRLDLSTGAALVGISAFPESKADHPKPTTDVPGCTDAVLGTLLEAHVNLSGCFLHFPQYEPSWEPIADIVIPLCTSAG